MAFAGSAPLQCAPARSAGSWATFDQRPDHSDGPALRAGAPLKWRAPGERHIARSIRRLACLSQEIAQSCHGFGIGDAVDARRPVMALEGDDDFGKVDVDDVGDAFARPVDIDETVILA